MTDIIDLAKDSSIDSCSMLIHDDELCAALYGDESEYQEYLLSHLEYDC